MAENRRALLANPYSVNAIRKAAAISRNLIPAETPRRPIYSAPGRDYNGYFKVTDVSEDETLQVKVAFGRCRINNQYFAVPTESEDPEAVDFTIKEITSSGYIYLQCLFEEAPTIEFSEEMFEYEDGKCKRLLATVNLNDDNTAIALIDQTQFGFFSDEIFGSCSEEG